MPGAPVVAVSAKHRRRARRAARRARRRPPPRATRDGRATRLYVDRVFTLRGIGTVATGTLWSGSIGEGDELHVEPGGARCACAACRCTTRRSTRAEAGQRVAVALPGVERHELRRGDVLVAPGAYPSSYRLDIALERARRDTAARARPPRHGERARARRSRWRRFAQLRLAEPVVAARGDRVVLADTTVGGGRRARSVPPRHASAERMRLVERGEIAATCTSRFGAETLAHLGELRAASRNADGWVFSQAWLAELRAELGALAAPTRSTRGPPAGRSAWSGAVVPLLGLERRGAKLYLPGATAELGARAGSGGVRSRRSSASNR